MEVGGEPEGGGEASRSPRRDAPLLAEALGVVLVTSPVPSNPSTEMLEWVLRSFVEGGALHGCPKVVVSDGFTTAAEGQQPQPKSGRVPPEWAEPYAAFRDRVDGLVASAAGAFGRSAHVRMPKHAGFSGCLREGLAHLGRATYVLVLQHDRPCLRAFDCVGVVAALRASCGAVKYVGLPTKASLQRVKPAAIIQRCGVRLDQGQPYGAPAPSAAALAPGTSLEPLFFWYDSAHICETGHYRDWVFGHGKVRGPFLEDSFGQLMHVEIQEAAKAGTWREAHAAYGTFLYVDGGGPCVGHLKGRRYIDAADLRELGWNGWGLAEGSAPPPWLSGAAAAAVT